MTGMTEKSQFPNFMTFSGIMNDKKVTISQFYDLFRNYERLKGHSLVIMNDIVIDKKGHNFVNDKTYWFTGILCYNIFSFSVKNII